MAVKKRKMYNIALSKKQAYEIVSLVDDELAEAIITQIENQEEYKQVGKRKEYFKKYYLTHKEEYKERWQRYYAENFERYQKRGKEWRQKNKDYYKKYHEKMKKAKKDEKKSKKGLEKQKKAKEE